MSSKPHTTKRSGGALDHLSSPRKRTMHRKSPPLEKKVLLHGGRAPRSPFPPSPGERAFGDRARFLKAVEARRRSAGGGSGSGGHTASGSRSGGNVLAATPPPSLGLRGLGVRGVAPAAFRACEKAAAGGREKAADVAAAEEEDAVPEREQEDEESGSSSTLTGSSSLDECESESDREDGTKGAERVRARVGGRGRGWSTSESSSGSEGVHGGEDDDDDDGGHGDHADSSSGLSKLSAPRTNSKSNRWVQKRCQDDRSAGTPKCLAALFDATNRFGCSSPKNRDVQKPSGAAAAQAPSLGNRVKTVRSMRYSAGAADAADDAASKADGPFVLLALPSAGPQRDASTSSTGVRWTDAYDSLLANAVASAPPNRWDLVRKIGTSGEMSTPAATSSSVCHAAGKIAAETSPAATAATAASAASTPLAASAAGPASLASSTTSTATDHTENTALGTSRIGSPHTQLSVPILMNCDYTPPDTPAKNPPPLPASASSKTTIAGLSAFTPKDLQQRWRVICPPVKGPWARGEDAQLRACVEMFGEERWAHIAKHIPGRRGKQCRERWKNHLDPNLNKSRWTAAEDTALLAAQRRLGNKWSEISKLLGCGRGENSVKNRFHSLRLGAERSRGISGNSGNSGAGSRRCSSSRNRSSSQSTTPAFSSGASTSALSSSPPASDGESVAVAQVHARGRLRRSRSSSVSKVHLMPKRARLLGKGSVPIRRRHTFSGEQRIRSLSLGRLMNKSRRPSNAHIKMMTRAFLGVEITRLRRGLGHPKATASSTAHEAPSDISSTRINAITHNPIRRSNSGGLMMSSPVGSLAALKAAADVAAEAASALSTSSASSGSALAVAASSSVVTAMAAATSPEAKLKASFTTHKDAYAIHLVTSSFLGREQQQRSGVAGFYSDSASNNCVKLVQLVPKKNKAIARLRAQSQASASPSPHANAMGAKDPASALSEMGWNHGYDGHVASMPPRGSAANAEAAESLLALSLSGCGSPLSGFGSKDC